MPASLKSLTSARQTLTLLLATVALLAAASWLMFDLNRQRTEVFAARQELEIKESNARTLEPLAAGEQEQRAEQSRQFQELLLSDQTMPGFYSEITRIAADSQLDPRFGMTPEDRTIAEQTQTPEEAKMLAVGIKRYAVVTLSLKGDYPNVARFLGALSRLPRSIEYQTIDMRRETALVQVTLVMHVHKREGA
jgi:Tfp pilus assembly protein PilO